MQGLFPSNHTFLAKKMASSKSSIRTKYSSLQVLSWWHVSSFYVIVWSPTSRFHNMTVTKTYELPRKKWNTFLKLSNSWTFVAKRKTIRWRNPWWSSQGNGNVHNSVELLSLRLQENRGSVVIYDLLRQCEQHVDDENKCPKKYVAAENPTSKLFKLA